MLANMFIVPMLTWQEESLGIPKVIRMHPVETMIFGANPSIKIGNISLDKRPVLAR